MKRSITRRDILKISGGGILGMMLSPLPWKLLDDSAIWTQNWERTPKLSHEPISIRYANCVLCSAGCGITMKCVGGRPYYVSGVHKHPLTEGSLCARGIAGHHMANHPLRIIHPHTFTASSDSGRMIAISREAAIAAVADHIRTASGTIAILDQQPGRAISSVYHNFLSQTGKGIIVDSPAQENRTLQFLGRMVNGNQNDFGYDFEHTSLVLSFGAPLFDGWGVPGRMSALKKNGTVKFIQIEDRRSRTALQSDEWIAISPGMERYLALSIANVLLREELIVRSQLNSINDLTAMKRTAEQFTPEATAPFTGIPAERVRMIARELASVRSSIILSGSDAGGGPFDDETERFIASLNILLGSVGKPGGIIHKRPVPGTDNSVPATAWASIPDHSIEVLIIDSADSGNALPWRLIEQKLVEKKRCIVTLSPVLNEISAHSDYLIPAPGHLESLTESPSTGTGSTTTFSISVPALPAQEHCAEPIDVIRELSATLFPAAVIPSQEESLKQRSAAIHSSQRGSLFVYADGSMTPVKDLSTPDDLWSALMNGALWIDEMVQQKQHRSFTVGVQPTVLPPEGTQELKLTAHGWRGTTSSAQMPPIMSKLFQESDLRNLNGTVSINPATASSRGLTKDDHAVVSTLNGRMTVRVRIDPSIPPSMVLASIGPLANGKETPLHPAGENILNLCDVKHDGTWRLTPVELMKA